MPSRDPKRRFGDMLENIERIVAYTAGMDGAAFAEDAKTRDAVERCLERIAEAARKLGDGYDRTYPDIEFAKLRDFGSKLRHDYDGIDPSVVWTAVRHRLRRLAEVCEKELGRGAAGG